MVTHLEIQHIFINYEADTKFKLFEKQFKIRCY